VQVQDAGEDHRKTSTQAQSFRNNGIRHIVRDITTLSNLVLLEDLKIEN